MDVKKQAEKVKALVDGGMDLVEALQKVLMETQVPTNHVARIKHIKGLEDIAELQLLNRRAHAKLSAEKRGKAKPEAIARYEEEVRATKARLNALREGASKSDLLRMGAKPSSLVQYWLKEKENELVVRLAKLKATKKWTNPQLKAAIGLSSTVVPGELEEQLLKISPECLVNVEERIEKGDIRVVTVMKKWNLTK